MGWRTSRIRGSLVWLEHGTRWDGLRLALLNIETDAKMRANSSDRTMRYRRWTYDELANQYGDPEDWRYDGSVRRMLCGAEARQRLMNEFCLFWKADDADHAGLLFTADPFTGAEWERARIADRTERDGRHLTAVCEWGEEVRPSFRTEFRRIGKVGKRLTSASVTLKQLGKTSLLSLIGGNGNGDTP
jgi:hypothetical protein